VQLPYNLFESGALLERSTPDGTALEAARRRNLGVLVNRPLNAILPGHGRLVRLADPPSAGAPGSDDDLRSRLAALRERETALPEVFPTAPPAAVADLIESNWAALDDPRAWDGFVKGTLIPRARHGLQAQVASAQAQLTATQAERLQGYQSALNELLERLQARVQQQDPRLAARIRAAISPHLPSELRDESLSRLALDFVASSPNVSCVLNGMRHPSYVADAVGVMSLPPIPDVTAVAQALS
jgi:aryl-alcohol dehydrogenase-like predicted oxidoreductase